jgi:hypothetical protein
MRADATPPAWNGYRLTVACPCGLVFEGDRRLDECSCGALLVRVPAFG